MAIKTHLGGITNTQLIQESDGTTHILDVVDAKPAMDYVEQVNKGLAEKMSVREEFSLEYVIPLTLVQEWCKEAGVGVFDKEANFVIEKKMQDPYYSKLKVNHYNPFRHIS
jgi:hypothetical protein